MEDSLFTMEPPWRDNRRSRSCILPGKYRVVPHRSPRFGRCLLVTETPGRSHILFHGGNLGGDTGKGFVSHTAGCLLPGIRTGVIEVRGRRQKAVLSSRAAFRSVMEWAGDSAFILEIENV